MGERNQFMLQVAHNMRAPIGACLGMLDLLSGDYMGKVTPEQGDYLSRIERRLKVLNRAIGELPGRIPVNVILYPMEGDPLAASAFWKLAMSTRGSLMSISEDWP